MPCANTLHKVTCMIQHFHIATLVYSQVKLSPGKFTKKVLINKHRVKDAYFKLMCLWKCSQNQWTQHECPGSLMPMSHAVICELVSSLGRIKKDLPGVFLQRNGDGSHTINDKPFNWKLTFLTSLLIKAQATFLTVGLFCSPHLDAPLKPDQSHFTTVLFRRLRTSINCSGPHNRHLQYIISMYLSKIKCVSWLQCY